MGDRQFRVAAGGRLGLSLPQDPPQVRRRTTMAIGLLALASVVAAVGAALLDPRMPTAHQWRIAGVLAVTGLVAAFITARWGPRDSESSPPWDVHTVWLLPAALLTPPAAFGGLVVISVVLSLWKPAHSLSLRLVVCSITILTTVALHLSAQLVDDLVLAGLLGTAALWLIGVIIAVAIAHVFITPSGTAIWLDFRWSLVVIGCAFAGLVLAGAIQQDPLLGFAGLAPVLLAAFALRWPEIDRNALIDVKTGLPNARHWENRTRELLSVAELHTRPATVMILDIDRFKQVNDTYGHLAGDQVLTELAEVLRANTHAGDVVGRFGGEEFSITMFELDPAQAHAAAERIRAAVAAQQHRLVHSLRAPAESERVLRPGRGRTAKYDGAAGGDVCTITCTIGMASSRHFGYDLTTLLDHADTALREGKAAGRDTVRDAADIPEELLTPLLPLETGTVPLQRHAFAWWEVARRQRSMRRSGRNTRV